MNRERFARWTVLALALGLPLTVLVGGALLDRGGAVELRARMPEAGGWQPGQLVVRAGETLRLRLTSEDVVHGFAIGMLDLEPIDVRPGEVTEVTLSFDEPGRYVYYCTRWCGPDHWRMRGIIEVAGSVDARVESPPVPLFVELGLDLDSPHLARHVPAERPSAELGARLGVPLPADYLAPDLNRRRSPVEVWEELRSDSLTRRLSDMQTWDLVARLWAGNTTSEMLSEGERLYGANCAACHGEGGAGDGVMARSLARPPSEGAPTIGAAADSMTGVGHKTVTPADFSDPHSMLGASSALLEGKIIRGGMGTGMPYWGPIFTDRQIRALVDYLWTFEFDGLTRSAGQDRGVDVRAGGG